MRTFEEFMMLQEGDDPKKKSDAVKSEIKLGDVGAPPFMVTRDGARKNLSILVDAFLKSNEVPYGPKKLAKTGADSTPGQENSGLTRDKLQKKTLYLVGGAVRDHLLGSEANDYDLATDATMDEIRLILQHAGFSEVAPRTATGAPDEEDTTPKGDNYKHLPKSTGNKKIFFVQGTDINGEEFVMGANINGESFEIATFRRDSKGMSDGRTTKMEFTPNIEEDAERRDFTINAMYIPLNNSDGPNDKVIDFHGGMHDLKKNKVRFVGKAEDRLKEDELRLPRYARFAAQMGDEPDEEVLKAAEKFKGLPSLMPHEKEGRKRDRRGRIYDEIAKAMDKVKKGKIDVKKLLGLYEKLGLLNSAVFPGLDVQSASSLQPDTNLHLQMAWLLQKNDPDKIYDALVDAKWPKSDAKRIKFLIQMLKFHPFVDSDELHRFGQGFTDSGFSSGYLRGEKMGSPSHLERWGEMHGMDPGAIGAFLQHMSYGDIPANPNDPEFADLFTRDIHGNARGNVAVGAKKREMAYKRFKDLLQGKKPQNVEFSEE